jgi:hypothetical protein
VEKPPEGRPPSVFYAICRLRLNYREKMDATNRSFGYHSCDAPLLYPISDRTINQFRSTECTLSFLTANGWGVF